MAKIDNIFRPVSVCPVQTFLGTGLHTLGLTAWLLHQIGRSEVHVSTFSTSEDFLSGFSNLRKQGLISRALMLADIKAARKTVKLNAMLRQAFDRTYLGMNHSKVVLLLADSGQTVSVVTSQNNTYGGRAECTVVSTSQQMYLDLFSGLKQLYNQSVLIDDIYKRADSKDTAAGSVTDTGIGDWRPFGV